MLSIFQGRPTGSFIERLNSVSSINAFFFSATNSKHDEELKEKLDENLNFIKIEEHMMSRTYQTFALKMADSQYYNRDLGRLTRVKAVISRRPLDPSFVQDDHTGEQEIHARAREPLLPQIRMRDHSVLDFSEQREAHQSLKELPKRKLRAEGSTKRVPLPPGRRRRGLEAFWIQAQRGHAFYADTRVE